MDISAPKMAGDSQCYVRITGTLDDKFVEFDFSIEDPLMYVELVLPFDQFQVFCKRNKVKHLTAEQKAAVDYDRLKWRHGIPGKKENFENVTTENLSI